MPPRPFGSASFCCRSVREAQQATLLLGNLPAVSEALGQGAIVVIEENRIRVRMLPARGA